MYPELLVASYVIFRWNNLENDVAVTKRFITHIVIPFTESLYHHARDALCKRKPQPGMRPPPLQRPSSPIHATESSSAESSTEKSS